MHQGGPTPGGGNRRDSAEGFGRRAQRRLSGNVPAGSGQPQGPSKENKRPLTAVLSEDGASTSGQSASGSTGPAANQAAVPRQSFLSKLTRAEFGGKAAGLTGNQCDTSSQQPAGAQSAAGIHQRPAQANADSSRSQATSSPGEKNGEQDKREHHGEEDEEDDDNLVIPAWPSRSDTLGQRKSEFVQHKVYSLKDYSQVCNPSAAASAQPPVSAGNKLLKSMSQDRKVKSSSKRMSECIYPTSGSLLTSLAADNKAPTSTGQLVTASSSSSQLVGGGSSTAGLSSASFSATPGSSLLPAGGRGHAATTFAAESKIDRMRKLFVSPLSLRSSSNSNQQHQIKMGASQQARLSFQSMGAGSMLNKPHHMIHAMYRQGQPGGSVTGRSPMRAGSKKANLKGFRVYGCPLQMANNIYPITCFGRPDIYKQQSVPYVLARLCNYIEENSSNLTHEGIFRVSGNARLMEKLRTLFDRLGDAPLESESVDVATSASMLKMYLRELPEPLIPTRMNYYFITLAKKYALYLNSIKESNNFSSLSSSNNPAFGAKSRPSFLSAPPPTTTTTTENSSTTETSGSQQAPLSSADRQRLAFSRDLTKLVRKLPIENYNLLKYLACFLYRISLKQQYNKMCAEALGIVFGPNIFRIRSESYKGLKEQELSNQIMASIISNYRSIFDSDLTDPLGNLICELPASVPELVGSVVATGSQKERVEPALPAAGVSPGGQPGPEVGGSPRCRAEQCQHRHTDDEGDEVDDEEQSDEDEQEDDDDCDEGESYTPSSGSGSYCSSMDSNTLESSEYDPEGTNDESFNNRAGPRRRPAAGSRRRNQPRGPNSPSSSDCPSDTSYTPTSSHTDDDESVDYEDEEDEEDDEEGESFDSDDADEKVSPCSRCKSRRESSTQTGRPAGDDCDRDENIPPGAGTKRASSRRKKQLQAPEETSETGSRVEAVPPEASNQPTSGKQHHHHHHNHHHNQEEAGSGKQQQQQQAGAAGKAGHHKFDFFRRRSSSASSLGRIKRARDRLAQAKRRGLEEQPHGRRRLQQVPAGRPPRSSTNAAGGSRAGALGDSSARSSRKSQARPKQPLGGRSKRPSSSSNAFPDDPVEIVCENVSRLNLSPARLMQELGLEAPPSAHSNQLVDAFEYEPYFLLRAFNSDETLLRSTSYNDEFELDCCAKTPRRFSGHDLLDSKAQQLLKGPASLEQLDLEGCLAVANSILLEELAELDNSAANLSAEAAAAAEEQQREQLPVGGFRAAPQQLPSGLVCGQAVSSVSLLSQQNADYRQEVSLNSSASPNVSSSCKADERADGELLQQDALAVQMRALKSLVKSLRTLQKLAAAAGYTELMRAGIGRLRELPAGSNAYADDYAASSVDHLSASSAVDGVLELIAGAVIQQNAAIDEERNSHDDEASLSTAPISAEERQRLEEILASKIKLLKQRYNDLKTVREHYLGSHAEQLKQEESLFDLAALQSRDLSARIIESALERFSGLLEADKADKAPQTSSALELSASSAGPAADTAAGLQATPTPTSAGVQQAEAEAAPSEGSERLAGSRASCKFGSLCPIEFVFNIEKQLAWKRLLGSRLVKLNEMSPDQLQSEKLELQKNLLRYEHWFGRPLSRLDYSLVGHLYERYRAVKLIKARKLPPEAPPQVLSK